MFLDDFPPELIAELTAWAGGFGVISLWLSGATRLRQLLSIRGGVTHVKLVDTSLNSTSRWPKMLAEMRGLIDLRLDRGHAPLRCAPLVWQELQKMPQLRTLHLRCSDSGSILIEQSNWKIYQNLSEVFPHLEDLFLSLVSMSILNHHLPPTLIRLQLSASHITTQLYLNNEGHKGPILPRLEKLSLMRDFYDLPPFVLTLPLTELEYSPKDFNVGQQLSSTLLKLTLQRVTSTNFSNIIPNTLTYLCLYAYSFKIHNQMFRNQTALKTLILNRVDESYNAHFTAEPTSIFPTSLENLTLNCFFKTDRLILPPHLNSLVMLAPIFPESAIEYELQWDPDSVFMTSQTKTSNMTILNSSNASNSTSEDQMTEDIFVPTAKGLPPSLTKFSIKSRLIGGFSDEFIQKQLPHSMTYLRLTDTNLPSSSWSSLPPTLVHLECNDLIPFQSQDPSRLRNLTSLVLRIGAEYLDDSCLALMPPSLTLFELVYRNGVTQKALHHLPKGLLKLTLIGAPKSSAEMDATGFFYLSEFLDLQKVHLTFRMPQVEDGIFRMLPRSLIQLKLSGSCPMLTAACFEFLPRFLQTLHLQGLTNAKNRQIILLPRTLRRICLEEVRGLTADCMSLLPTTLTSATIGKHEPLPFVMWQMTRKIGEPTFPDSRIHENSFNFHSDMTLSTLSSSNLIKKQETRQNRKWLPYLWFAVGFIPILMAIIFKYQFQRIF
jgi:hypothetical protein